MKFIKADYLQESENSTYNKIVGRPDNNTTLKSGEKPGPKSKVAEILQKEEKMRRELEKIRKLDTELA